MKRLPLGFLRARLLVLFLLSLAATYGVGLSLAPASLRRPWSMTWPPCALAAATLVGAALADRFYSFVDRAGRGRLQLLGWSVYGVVLLTVVFGILSKDGQQAVRTGAGAMRLAQIGFLLFAGLGRGYLGALTNAFAMTVVAVLGGGAAAAGAVAVYSGLLVVFLVADYHARLLTDYPVDAPAESGPVLRRAFGMGAALAGALLLFFVWIPCEPYALLLSRGGVPQAIPQDQVWALVRDLVAVTIVAGLAFWLVLWLGGGRGRDTGDVPSERVAARRTAEPLRPVAVGGEAPDAQGWRARIVKLYVQLGEQLSRLGVRRRPDQTPREFAGALGPEGPAEALTDLFVRARYGDRELGEPDFHAASAAGVEILAHLRRDKTNR
jgi:uncharacterized protein DUF4129